MSEIAHSLSFFATFKQTFWSLLGCKSTLNRNTRFVFFQHLEKSSEESGETERLKQLVSENSSLKERTSELQNQLQRLLEKLKNEKEKVRR